MTQRGILLFSAASSSVFCTVLTQYIIQLHSHTNSNTSTGESTFFCRAPPCFSAARALGPCARQHVPSCIRWTSEQWPRLGAGGCDSKLQEKGVHQWPRVCVRCVVWLTAGQRERESDWSICHLEHRGPIPDEAENLCHFYQFTGRALTWIQTPFRAELAVPGYASGDGTHQFGECEMSHYKVCSNPPPLKVDWPIMWSAGQVKF